LARTANAREARIAEDAQNGEDRTGRDKKLHFEMMDRARAQREVMQWLHQRVLDLPFRLGGQEPEMPLGSHVLVLKGEAMNDLGQMAVISGVAGSQVVISYRGPTGTIMTRRKRRSSLIRMEEGVELAVNAEGWPIIRASVNRETTAENEDRGVVSADDESRAQ
jgi:hypothetical protein